MMNKKVFMIGEDLLNSVFTNLLSQTAKDVLPLVDALRALVAEQNKPSEAKDANVQS